jgi:hypothetical protein
MYRIIPNATAFSGQAPAVEGVYVNTFNVHPVLGRLGLLNCHRPVYPLTFGHADETDDWSLSDWCDQCHRKGGLVVWCGAYRPAAGLPGGEALVNAILGKVDAIEIDALDRTTSFLPRWYRLLNAGIRLALVGGSGKDSNRIALGGVRTLTQRTASGSYADWVEQVKAGRTVATNGPVVLMAVGGERFPGRIGQTGPAPIGLRAQAASAVPFDRLEMLANGSVIAAVRPDATDPWTATAEVEHTLPAGGWLAARCVGVAKSDLYPHVPVFAHTSPVWVEVTGHPVPKGMEAVEALRPEVQGVREWVETEGQFTHPRRKEHLLALCDAAAARLAGAR